MEKWVKIFSVLLGFFMVSGCLWEPSNATNIGNSWQAREYKIASAIPEEAVELQCQLSDGTWQTFAKGKTDTIVTVTGVNDLYQLRLTAVVPADCWSNVDVPDSSKGAWYAKVHAKIGDEAVLTFTDTQKNCVVNGDANHIWNDNPPDWINRVWQCTTGNTDTILYANHHDPYLVQSNSWNYVFQQQYIGAINQNGDVDPNRWIVGDGGGHIDLPYCDECSAAEKYRKMWIFGDSAVGGIDKNNKIHPFTGMSWGNTIAITSHGNTNTKLAIDSPLFDWNAKPETDPLTNHDISHYSWMPLLIDTSKNVNETQILPALHPLRIATRGYTGLGFTANQVSIGRVYRSPWNDETKTRNNNLVPIYEYYNPSTTMSYYTRVKIENGDTYGTYQRVAFWVFNPEVTKPTGTIFLYSNYNSVLSDFTLLATENNLANIEGRVLLGYIYPSASTTATGTYNLWEYSLSDFSPSDDHHVYTTYKHDVGGDLNTPPPAMWPSGGVTIGNDLVLTFTPMFLVDGWFRAVEKGVVAIVKDVNKPYYQNKELQKWWGKTVQYDWTENKTDTTAVMRPKQYSLEKNNASIAWNYIMKAPDYDTNTTNKYVYIYSLRDVHDVFPDGTFHTDYYRFSDVILARVDCQNENGEQKAEAFINFGNWQYFRYAVRCAVGEPDCVNDTDSISSWVGNQDKATAVAEKIGIAGIVKNPTKDNYILVSTVYGWPHLIIKLYSSASPKGPFTNPKTVDITTYDLERDFASSNCMTDGHYDYGKCQYYSVVVHPGLSFGGDNSGLMLSYVRSWPGELDPSMGLPRFINVPWSAINQSIDNSIETIDLQVSESTDDIHFFWNSSAWVGELGFEQTGVGNLAGFGLWKNGCGMRFKSVTIPAGSTITKAYLTFTAQQDREEVTVKSRITGSLEPNAATFSTVADYRRRRGTVVGGANNNGRTVAQVTWDASMPAWKENNAYTTPDLKSIIQEIINQTSWSSGNAMVLFWDDHEGRTSENTINIAQTYDGDDHSKAARLHIEYYRNAQ